MGISGTFYMERTCFIENGGEVRLNQTEESELGKTSANLTGRKS